VSARSVDVLSVPYHEGRRGAGMGRGPIELLERHGLRDELERRGLPVTVQEVSEPPEGTKIARTIELDRRLATLVRSVVDRDAFPLVVAGNCSSCLGTLAGLDRDVGIVWFDAHADFDTSEGNVSGFFDFMALAIATGTGWRTLRESIPGFRPVEERNVVLVGVRDLEPPRRERLEASSVEVAPGAARMGEIGTLVDDLSRRVRDVYLHVDLDVLDPAEGQANEYAVPDGLPLETLTDAVTLVGEWLEVRAAAVTAYDPAFDSTGSVARAALEVAAAAAAAGVRRTP
jgi:arginase